MKHKFVIVLVSLIFSCSSILAQDVAICGWEGTTDDKFSFVLLRDYLAGEIIYFTEDEYSDSSNAFNTSEGHIAYTIPAGGLLENEVISIIESGADTYTVGCASGTAVHVPSTGSWSFSTSDEIYAYSASNAASPWNTVTEIHCFVWSSPAPFPVDQNPVSDYPDVISIAFNLGGSVGVNADFIDSNRTNTTLAMLQDGSNWTQSTSNIALSCTDFIGQTLGIYDVSFDVSSLTLYPVPASNFVILKNPNNVELLNIILVDITGRIIQSKNKTNDSEFRIDISELNNAMYFISIQAENTKRSFKIIKN